MMLISKDINGVDTQCRIRANMSTSIQIAAGGGGAGPEIRFRLARNLYHTDTQVCFSCLRFDGRSCFIFRSPMGV